jgi:endothelin-converting enzyme
MDLIQTVIDLIILGFQLDFQGVKHEWASKFSRDAFYDHSKCFVKQYSKQDVTLSTGKTRFVDGRLTLSENIADNGGMFTAFSAFKNRMKHKDIYDKADQLFSPAQTFFLSFSQAWCSKRMDSTLLFMLKDDVHSPNRVRVNTVLKNSEEFAKAFGCTSKDTMVFQKSEQCRLY